MLLTLLAHIFPAWKLHFSFLESPLANEMIVLRWLHLVFGVLWIGMLYFFNLVLTPAMKQVDPSARLKIYPALMSKAMFWFRWSALITVLVGLRYFQLYLSADARNAGDPSLAWKWLGWWLLVWGVAYLFLYALQLPAKGFRNNAWMRALTIAIVVIAASWLVLALNVGPTSSSAHLAISVGGGLGLVMLLNTWLVVWPVQKKLIAWARASSEQGVSMPPETERLMRWVFLTARVSFWLSFPMLLFMAAASHYPFLSTLPR
ncbi:MAG: hypothetical protein WA857_02895 [Candidatus Acidiferrum sp.]